MIKDRYKLIHYLGYGNGYDDAYELYDLKQDPDELQDLITTNTGIASDLEAELKAELQLVNHLYKPA